MAFCVISVLVIVVFFVTDAFLLFLIILKHVHVTTGSNTFDLMSEGGGESHSKINNEEGKNQILAKVEAISFHQKICKIIIQLKYCSNVNRE